MRVGIGQSAATQGKLRFMQTNIPATAVSNTYPLGAEDYDEMIDAHGQVRPHWSYLVEEIGKLAGSEMDLRRKEALKLLRENGVTYNVYGDPDGSSRPWLLDPVPLLISGDEWCEIEAGLKQRAELLNMILADIYGARELTKNNLLPLELIYNHAGFLRACDQARLPGHHQLVLYAADLARGPDQKMWVIGDRTQAPSGAGYTLENRIAVSRVLPSIFRHSQAHRLVHYFQSMQAGLNAIAPTHAESPRIVVLTPGPFNETYFEHSYLASFLGYPLVQGDDLTVRDGYVWLKSLTGLQRVDVIIRRVDDSYCDPLELRSESRLGIAGLLEVARRGNVAIANPLGSSILENPGIQPFLPGIAKHFFGEPLKLQSAATWWCGHPPEMNHVLANLENLVIKPIYRNPGESPVLGHMLSKAECALWRDRIRANPALYVGQEHVSFSTAPCVTPSGFEPRKVLLRCFAVATRNGYEVMPGGLSRSAPERGDIPISGQMGSISKDTWVLTDRPQDGVEHVSQAGSLAPMAGHNNALPSRAADNIFWVGRYAERAEGSIRFMRATIKKLYINPDRSNPDYSGSLQLLLCGVTNLTGTWPGFYDEEQETLPQSPEAELISVTLDEQRIGSIANSLRNLVQASYSVRDLWSSDTWRVMDELEASLTYPQQLDDSALWQMHEHLDRLISSISAFSGLIMENMTRGNGWLFLDIGRRLERSLQLISTMRTIFSVHRSDGEQTQLIESMLDSSDNIICYRHHYRSYFELPSFLELLLLDTNNPRSLAFQIDKLSSHVSKLPRTQQAQRLSPEERLVLEASSIIKLVNLEDLLVTTEIGVRENLDQQLSHLSTLLIDLSDTITAEHFRHGSGPQPL
ncbi:MAG: circularly permuted type 2 ATP-grasp protein [Gallionella sp.]